MSEKHQLIQVFKSLDFEELGNLLDDNRSYMEVTKTLFLSTLKQKLDNYKDLISYEKVEEGICGKCNKGCKAYKFKADKFPSLNLFFEEKNGKVTDIYLCTAIKTETTDESNWDIFFSFHEEDKVNFSPTINYNINLQNIDEAIKEFNNLELIGLVTIQDVNHWYKKHKNLADKLDLNDPFAVRKYKAFEHIDSLYSKVSDLVHNYNNNHLAIEAMKQYQQLNMDDEKTIVCWLLNYKNNYFFSLKKTDNWRKTGIIILETQPNLVVDCSDYLDSFLFEEIYNHHHSQIMTKYEPTIEHFEKNEGSIKWSLESYLKLHNKYLDLF